MAINLTPRQRELDTDNNFMQIEINNRLGKVKLNSGVNKDSADDLIDKLDKLYGSRAVAAQMCIGEIVCKADDAIDGIEIEINTPGGSVFEGQRIFNALREMSARGVEITATVNGLAASMGSVILMAGDNRRMTAGSRVMIHEASTIAAGDARALNKQADLLESISAEIAGIYAERSGMDEDDIRKMMMAETWMTADEAKANGFVDVILKDGKEVMQFDTAPKSMSILSKLFPGNDEAVKIEAAIAENDTLRADLTTAQALIAELSGHAEVIAQLRAELATEQETAVETIEKVKELETKIEKLEEQTEVSDDKVNVRAAELLASTGHPAPVALAGDTNEAPVSHLKAMASMKPLEAAEYFALHKAEILSDKNRYAV
jgi:ATP-dependent Clp endopeptidase proteolytic subunit ClpP